MTVDPSFKLGIEDFAKGNEVEGGSQNRRAGWRWAFDYFWVHGEKLVVENCDLCHKININT